MDYPTISILLTSRVFAAESTIFVRCTQETLHCHKDIRHNK